MRRQSREHYSKNSGKAESIEIPWLDLVWVNVPTVSFFRSIDSALFAEILTVNCVDSTFIVES